MKNITGYLLTYLRTLNRSVALWCTVFAAAAVFVNYRFNLNKAIYRLDGVEKFAGWYAVFLAAMGFGYAAQAAFANWNGFRHPKFVALLAVAPAVFAWKMTADVDFRFATDYFVNAYWNAVVYWPVKVGVIAAMLLVIHRLINRREPFYGLTLNGFSPKPYVIMLLLMVPLIAAASALPDFQRMYPRMNNVEYLLQPDRGWHKLLYQLSYGSDFLSIELFFRGFLVLAFARFAGQGAILPMAIFYCTIHFGKPLGECISSYFGGIILGVVSYHTRSVVGGFAVHVGIAWLMEAGGYFGARFF